MSWQSLINLPLFFLLTLIFFTAPGTILTEKSSIRGNFWEKIAVGTIVGFIVFTLLSYFLSTLKLGILLLPILVTFNILNFNKLKAFLSSSYRPTKKIVLSAASIFVLGVLGQLLVIAPSGVFNDQGLVFWSSHGHDAPWHISLMEEYKKGSPLQNPVFAGEKLVNYHFFSDIAPAEFNRYFALSNLDLYFRFFPLLYSLMLGSAAFLLGNRLGGFSAGIWSTIFTFGAGSFGYIFTFFKDRSIGGETLFGATQPQSSIGNPPQIVSLIVVLTFLYLFPQVWDNRSKLAYLILGILAGTLISFKVYGGIVVLVALGITGLWQLIREFKIHILALTVFSGILSLVLFLPNSAGTSTFLIWEPWWFIRTMIVAPDKLNWLDLELRRQTYFAEHNLKRVAELEIIGFLIFLFGNLGTRFIGVLEFFKSSRKIASEYLYTLTLGILILSLVTPLLFLQKGVAGNTIQFMQYLLLLMGVLAGVTIANVLGRIKSQAISTLLSFGLILFSLPTQAGLIYSFYKGAPLAVISYKELDALQFIKELTDNGTILSPPFQKGLKVSSPTPPIWAWSDSAYIAAFSSHRVFLEDGEQVDIMGYNFQDRLKIQKIIFTGLEIQEVEKSLKASGAKYLYFPKALKPKADLSHLPLKQIYKNSEIEIWKII